MIQEMASEFEKLHHDFQKKKGMLESAQNNLKKEKTKQKELEQYQKTGEEALVILQTVAQETQKNLEYRMSNIVTTALSAVFPEPPEFLAKIIVKRKKTECKLLFKEFEEESNPIDSSGGGALDVASFALRVSYWSLKGGRPVFILDEPFRNVSYNLQSKVSQMVKELSGRLGIQFIIVSHQEDAITHADRVFNVKKKGQESTVYEI